MKEVTKEEFWQFVNGYDGDLVYNIENPYSYPYTGIFTLRHLSDVKAKRVGSCPPGKIYPITTKYYIQ
jgi:hypothetical protein